MRKFLALLMIFISINCFGDNVTLNTDYYTAVSATDVSTSLTFTKPVNQVLIINDGANEIFVNLNGTTGATTDFQLNSGESIVVPITTAGVGIICSSGETATVRVLGIASV